MTGRIKGAELCHRIDAAKQLVKYGSKDAAEFLAKYKGVPCGHSINGRPNQADPCSVEERSLVAVTLNAPPTLTRDFLTVLSGIDEFLMARLIRAQTADGVTIIEFLDDVMQDRTDGFKTHHRIAAAKELIVHIIRDEQGSQTPSPSTGEGWGEGDSPVVGADPRVRPLPGSQTPSPLTKRAGVRVTHPSFRRGPEPRGAAGPVTPQPTPLTLSPTHPSFPRKACPVLDTGREPIPGPPLWESPPPSVRIPSPLTLPKDDRTTKPAPNTTHPNTATPGRKRQGRRFRMGSERNNEEKNEKPAPVELTIAEFKELKHHWHEPDPWAAPIDSQPQALAPLALTPSPSNPPIHTGGRREDSEGCEGDYRDYPGMYSGRREIAGRPAGALGGADDGLRWARGGKLRTEDTEGTARGPWWREFASVVRWARWQTGAVRLGVEWPEPG